MYLLCVSVCVCVRVRVCVCVDDFSRATGYKTNIERYQWPRRYKGLENNVAIYYFCVQEIWLENK